MFFRIHVWPSHLLSDEFLEIKTAFDKAGFEYEIVDDEQYDPAVYVESPFRSFISAINAHEAESILQSISIVNGDLYRDGISVTEYNRRLGEMELDDYSS